MGFLFKFSIFSWVSFSLCLSLSFSLKAAPLEYGIADDISIVSDYDDTLTNANLRRKVPFKKAVMAIEFLYIPETFVKGMASLLTSAKNNGAHIHILTGRLARFRQKTENEMNLEKLPYDSITLRAEKNDELLDYKYDAIVKLMIENPNRRFVLIGDNTQKDAEVFHRIYMNPELNRQIIGVFIREVKRPPLGAYIYPEQRKFKTSISLALNFLRLKIVSTNEATALVNKVAQDAETPKILDRQRVLPNFVDSDTEDFKLVSSYGREAGYPQEEPGFKRFLSWLKNKLTNHWSAGQCLDVYY